MIIILPFRLLIRLPPIFVFMGGWIFSGAFICGIARQAFLHPTGLRLQDAWVIPVALLTAFLLRGLYGDAFKNEEESGVAGFLESVIGLSMHAIFLLAVVSLGTGVAIGATLDSNARPSRLVSAHQRTSKPGASRSAVQLVKVVEPAKAAPVKVEARSVAAEPVKVPARSGQAALRLQGIFYSSTKPSALVNGKTIFVGEEISGWRVAAIEPNSVFLQHANGETNILALR
jgi:hypothetical protein